MRAGPGAPGANRAPWAARTLPGLLAAHGLERSAEEPFAHDGWSGASLSLLRRGDERFILKRTSWAMDWIARSTRDHALREAVVAAEPPPLAAPLSNVYLGAARDGRAAAILMPDLGEELIPWDRPSGSGTAAGQAAVPAASLDRILAAAAALHAMPWAELRAAPDGLRWPWCPLRERIQLLSRTSAIRYRAGGLPIGERFLAGWDAFERLAPPRAVRLVRRLSSDPGPLLAALDRLPATGLHGDLKFANVALRPDGTVGLIDWQMTAYGPIAVELAWFLVANVSGLGEPPEAAWERYLGAHSASARGRIVGDPEEQLDLAALVGLLLRGWRKGLDAAGRLVHPSGATAADDLSWWCDRALGAAERRL